MSDRADRRKRSNIRQYSAEDQALNQISKEADLRLQAKRAARAEAREIRLKEIEKQQKEAEERQDRLHGLTSDHVKTRQLSGSRRNSTDSTESMESRDRDRDLRAENRELEEKYKQAMMTSATLDNEKQTLVYQLELLKDQIEEMEEGHIELQREHKDRCRELEMKKRAYTELEAEVKILKEHMVLKDKLIEESGFVIMSTEDGSYKLEKNTSLSNGPVPSGGSVLLSTDSIALLKEAGDGSLGTASQHHSRSSPMHETNPSRNGNVDIAESESQGSQGSNLVQGVEFLAKDKGSEVSAEEQAKSVSDVNKDTEGNLNDPVGKEGGESEDIPSDSGSVLTHEKELVETSSSEADSNKDQPAIVTDVVDRAECADVGKNKEMGSDVSSGIIETNVTDQSEVNVSKDPVDFNSGTDKDGTVCSVNDIVEVAEKVCKDEADSKMCAPVLELDLVKDSPDGIPRDDSGIFSPDDVAVPHAGFSSGKFDVKIIEPEPDTDEEGDEFFDAVSTPSPFLNKTGSQYDFKEGEDHQKFAENEGKISSDSENNETEKSLGSTTTNRDVQRKDSNSKTNNEEFVQTVPEDSGKLDIEEDTEEDGVDSTKKVVTEGQKVEEQQSDEQRDVNGETHITKTTFDNNEDQVDLVVKSEDTAQTQPVALFSETKSDDKMKSNENVMEDSDFPTAVDSVDGSECSEIVTGESVDTSTKVSTTLHSAELDLINGTHCKKEDKLAKTGSEDTESDVDEDDDQFKDAEEIDQEKDTFETVSPQDVHSDNDEKDAEVRQKNKAEKKDEMKSLNSEEMYGSSVDPVENEPEAANKVVPCTEDSEVNVCGQLSGDTTQESETSQAEQETKHIESEDNSGFHFVSIDGIVTGESETDNHEEELSNVSRELEVQNAGPVDTEQIQEMQDTDVDITLSKGAEGGEDDTEERSETGLFSEKISAELQQTQESVEEQNEPTGLERGDEVEGGDIDTSTENPEDSKADIIHTNDVQDRAHESSSDTFTDEKKSCQKKASGVNSEDMNADDMSSETKPEETKHTDSKEPLEEMKQTENGESPCIEEMKPAESKEEPFTEDVKQTDCGEGPCTEDVKQTESGEGPSTEDVKQTESGEGPSTEDVKQTESGEGPCEDVKQTESGENPCTEDVKQTESGEGPCEDVKQTESGENPCTEDVKQTENREGPCEDVKQTESGEGPSTEDVKQTESGEDPCTEDVKQTENREGPWAEEPKSEKTKDQEQELVPGVTESGANDKDSKCEKSEVDIIDKDNDEETSDKDADGTEEGDNEHKEDGVTKERRESQNDLKEDTLDEDKTKSVEGDQLEDKVSRKEGNNQAVDEKKKEDISARGEINKEKTFKRSECSVDSDDDVFVKDSVSPHKDDVPESAVSPSKKKSGSQMKSEGELSEDDLLDDAYSFDDIDEVLEEDDDQKVDGEKKDQSPKKQSQVVDPPMIVIDKASTDTEHEEKDENQSIASSTKASSSDSVSTGSGKDATELVSDDAGYGGSGAEGTAVHPPPSPKEGKKGKKFGKFFKNIFKYEKLKALGAANKQLKEQIKNLESKMSEVSSKQKDSKVPTLNGPELQLYEIQRESSKQIHEYKFKLQKAEQDIANLEGSVNRLEGQVKRYKSDAERAESVEDELKTEKRRLMRELREAQSEIEELTNQNKHLNKRMEKIKQTRTALGVQ